MLNIIITLIYVIIAAVQILFIVWIIWTIAWIPIKKRESMNKELEYERQELSKIQAQKGVEWESYMRLNDELGKIRSSLIDAKEALDKQKLDNEKLKEFNDNLKKVNADLKKQGDTKILV